LHDRIWIAPLVAAALTAACVGPARQQPTPAQRRMALLDAPADAQSVPQLVRALDDSNVVVRRTSARLLARLGEPATSGLAKAQANDDVLVRRTGLVGLTRLGGVVALSGVERALTDSSAVVRLLAVQHLESSRPHSPAVLALLESARDDEDESVRVVVARATWPFHRDSASIRDQQMDRDVVVAESIRLPKEGWRFHLDPGRNGHLHDWYQIDFEDAAWDTISIEQAWQKAGYDYIGVTWYRGTFRLPTRPEHLAVDLRFAGVDETAWVWLNGDYVGEHDIGPSGWNKPFHFDVTGMLRWEGVNQITVRAMNTAHAGGIWRPVELEVLR
jgi:hypothetical protein